LPRLYGRYNKKAVESQGENCELTKREIAVLVQVAKGMTSKEIADKLNVSTNTVITHRKNISRKTGIKSVAGLTVYAMLNNLITVAQCKICSKKSTKETKLASHPIKVRILRKKISRVNCNFLQTF
jgi:DNA-binding CsgD family transcriptional regulator